MSLTLELVTFRIRPEYEPNFPAANGAVNAWLADQPGYVSRHLSRTPDGEWIDAVLWQSNATAWAAAEKIMKEIGECEAMRAIDPATIVMRHGSVALTHRANQLQAVSAGDAA
jgi:hypothetical protein